ncbi:MAG: OmpA family protein [Syntrophaceae bacterium]
MTQFPPSRQAINDEGGNRYESILFESGKAEVKADALEALKKVADVLKSTTNKDIIVAGYTDNVPIKGRLTRTYPTNWELSAARAISVVKILAADGVDPKLLNATGYSEYHPVEENDTPEERAKNRRMEIILMPKRS